VNQYRIVSTVTRLWSGPMKNHGSVPCILFSKVSVLAVELTLLLIQCIPGALSLQLEWLGYESDYSPLSYAVVNNEQYYIFTSPVHLHGM